MFKHRLKNLLAASFTLLDASALLLAYESAYRIRFEFRPFLAAFPLTKGFPGPSIYHQALYALLPMCLLAFLYVGFYNHQLLSAYDELIRVFKGVVLAALSGAALTFTYRGAEYSRLVIGLWALLSIALIYSFREMDKLLFRNLLHRLSGSQRTLVIGEGKILDVLRQMSRIQPLTKIDSLEPSASLQVLEKRFRERNVREVVLVQNQMSSGAIVEISQLCEAHEIDCRIIPDVLEMRRGEIIVDGFFGLPTFQIKSLSLHGTNYLLKRGFDIVVSLSLLAVLFFPLLLVSFLIYLDDPGSIFYAQERFGLHHRKFKLLKFRTMIVNADALVEQLRPLNERAGGPSFKMKKDPRTTRAGRWLRKFSIDEIPQILNVLKGEMSLVGPRPHVLWEVSHYDDHARKRLRLRPGITGLWQVSGRAALSFEEMIDLDIFYLENWSLGLDLKILLRTIPAIFSQHGAY